MNYPQLIRKVTSSCCTSLPKIEIDPERIPELNFPHGRIALVESSGDSVVLEARNGGQFMGTIYLSDNFDWVIGRDGSSSNHLCLIPLKK